MANFNFKIEKKEKNSLARAGVFSTPHGEIHTPAFISVGTKATIKSLTPEIVASLGAEAVLANTYHLYLEPGDELVAKAGGLHSFMNWQGPIVTDSGGFQVFSLGEAFGKGGISKVAKNESASPQPLPTGQAGSPYQGEGENSAKLCTIDEEGVTFRSHIDGSEHRFTPERSMEIQWNLGADIIFAFDECTSPHASLDYQNEALDRTHRWAERSLKRHEELDVENKQALFGVVQGGRSEELRKKSAETLAKMNFDGFGIGGSFNKEDIGTAVRWVNEILPEGKPRHLLGIGEPTDLLHAIENGCDFFDCVAPTRNARNGSLYTKNGTVNILNSKFREDLAPLEADCRCYTCTNYSRAYLAHLFRAKEMLAATLASIHNLYFIITLVKNAREAILQEDFHTFKDSFLKKYLA